MRVVVRSTDLDIFAVLVDALKVAADIAYQRGLRSHTAGQPTQQATATHNAGQQDGTGRVGWVRRTARLRCGVRGARAVQSGVKASVCGC